MNCKHFWSWEHYVPHHLERHLSIDRIAPSVNSIFLAWCGGKGPWTVCIRPKGSEEPWKQFETADSQLPIENLKTDEDHEFFVSSQDGIKSEIGYARTGDFPGIVVNYLHPEDIKYAFSGRCLCTPSLLIHPDGYYLASMDLYEGSSPQNLTLIFRSDDRGQTWYHISELFPCFWGTLFLHRGDVYMLATSTEYGDLLIGKSVDGGKTWLEPTVLARGSSHQVVPGWHKSSMPILKHHGRLWCGVDYGSHKSGGHMTCLVSADADADLLDAASWTITKPLKYDPNWEGAVVGDNRGFIEGNAVAMPNGDVGNIIRYFTDRGNPKYGLAGLLKGNVNDPDEALSFYKFVPFPGNLSKFDVQWDERSGCYFSILSRITNPDRPGMRNVLALAYSKDLEHWKVACDLINYADSDPRRVGFQYVSFAFEGEDIVYLCRTAVNGAKNFHDSNCITFHRIEGFRDLISE